jgi:hypothetical protein
VEVGLHELFIKIHFIEIPVQAKDNVHVIQASDLRPTREGGGGGKSGFLPYPVTSAIKNLTFLCLRK